MNMLPFLFKTFRSKINAIVIGLLALLWILITPVLADHRLSTKAVAHPGFPAPTFELSDLNSLPVALESMKGKIIIVNIWASWCGPCQAEMPALQRIYEKYKASGLEILAVNSTYQDDPIRAANFVEVNKLTFPILLDVDGAVTRLYKVRALPTTIFIQKDGIINDLIVGGPLSEALLSSKVIELLGGSK